MFLSTSLSTAAILVALFVALFSGAAGAINCYQQPAIGREIANPENMKSNKDTWKPYDCFGLDRCVIAKKCSVNIPDRSVKMEDQDLRGCAISDNDCNVPSRLFNDKTPNEACPGGCRICGTDMCNDKVEGEETTTAKNEEKKNNNNTEGGEGNGGSDGSDGSSGSGGSRGSAVPILPLLLAGTMIPMVFGIGTLLKMCWMI